MRARRQLVFIFGGVGLFAVMVLLMLALLAASVLYKIYKDSDGGPP